MKTCGVCQAPKIRTDCSRTSRENAIFARPWRGQEGPEGARGGQRGPLMRIMRLKICTNTSLTERERVGEHKKHRHGGQTG